MMALYSELQDPDCPPIMSRANIERSTRASEKSMNLDDLSDVRTESYRDPSNFSRSCWEEEPGESGKGNFFDLADEFIGEEDDRSLGTDNEEDTLVFQTQPSPQSLNWPFKDDRKRKVRFSPETQVYSVEKADREDYHILYYCGHELQNMTDEFKEEENARLHNIRYSSISIFGKGAHKLAMK
jgi:hypothetical protein